MSLLKESWLENELNQAKNPPLLVIDFRVYAHAIHSFTESALDIAGDDENTLRTIIRALWAYRLNRGVDSLPLRDYTIIIVDDNKGPIPEMGEGYTGYWRHKEAHALGMPEYKGGRPDKPSLFSIVLDEGFKYVKAENSPFHFFDKPYYEADDIAGKIARIQRTDPPLDRHILLSTLDGDWQGLVSDQHKIVWCNTGPWLPRIRCEAEVCDYYLRKEKLHIASARETYTVKVEVGDAGDNLLPGTSLRFFDLHEEDLVWGWTEEETERLSGVMANRQPSNRPDHLEKSKRYLQSLGMFLPEIPAPTPADVRIFHERAIKERRDARFPAEIRSFPNKKYCAEVSDPSLFTKCVKIVSDDKAAHERIKDLEEKKKRSPDSIDLAELKELKQQRKDHKAMLLRFNAQAKKV